MNKIKLDVRDETTDHRLKCSGCQNSTHAPIDIAFAFQPIVDVNSESIFACEALVRGSHGESAYSVLSQVDATNRYQFDQRCRQVAIANATAVGIDSYLSINFMPNAVYRPEVCIRSTLEAARTHGFPVERIIFETVEGEAISDRAHLVDIFMAYKEFGFQTAIDDFGAGYSGLSLLVDFQPDFVKLDMALLRGIDTDDVRQKVVRGVIAICKDLGIRVIAEGIETKGERDFFIAHDVGLMQGYWFAKPEFNALPRIDKSAFAK